VDPALQQLDKALPALQGWLVGWVGRMFQNVVQLAGLVVIPLLAFYLLAEREEVRASWMGFVPAGAEPHLERIGHAVDRALASYVRGQAVVCVVSGGVMTIVLSIMGISHALLLGFLVAIAEILPFLGFWMAAIAIGLVGLGEGPIRAATAIGAYVVSNATIGLLVTPRVMSRHLKLHPFVVTVSVLAGGELLGPPGVLLALPAAAIAQALVETYTGRSERKKSRAQA
jgi:predicted PurR-regulated permease PerM